MHREHVARAAVIVLAGAVMGCAGSDLPTTTPQAPLLSVTSTIDDANAYPNVVSLIGLTYDPYGIPVAGYVSCSGSVLHVDATKVVLLTAAHCTEAWEQGIAEGGLNTIGVSWAVDNRPSGRAALAGYVRGGVPISFVRNFNPVERNDYGMLVLARDDTNTDGQTIDQLATAAGLTPVTLPSGPGYLADLVAEVPVPQLNMAFTAVGYGIGAPAPGAGGITYDNSVFLRRHIASGLTYNAYNPGDDVLRLSMNANLGEGFDCFGDSGGPIFYTMPDGSRIVVSVVSSGDAVCKATSTGPAFGKAIAYDFAGCGSVPGDAAAVKACVDDLFQ